MISQMQCYMLSLRKKIQGSYKLDGHTLKQVPSNPYLGVQIQEDLKWKEHINNVTKKASSTLGFLRRNLQHWPRECRKTAYITLVQSIMEYRAIILDPYNKNDINKLENLQWRGARFITKDYNFLVNTVWLNKQVKIDKRTIFYPECDVVQQGCKVC